MKKVSLVALTLTLFGFGLMSHPASSMPQTAPVSRFMSENLAPSDHAKPVGDNKIGYDFTIKNASGYKIKNIYMGEAGKEKWGKELTGGKGLSTGSELKIHYEPEGHGANTPKYDMKFVWGEAVENGDDTDIVKNLDLKNAKKVTLHYNENTDVTTAEVS